MSKWKRKISKKRRWQRDHLIQRDGAHCVICEKTFASMKDITFDHIIPRSKGGDDELENLQLAHFDCNQLKDDMMPDDFDDFQKESKLF